MHAKFLELAKITRTRFDLPISKKKKKKKIAKKFFVSCKGHDFKTKFYCYLHLETCGLKKQLTLTTMLKNSGKKLTIVVITTVNYGSICYFSFS